MTTSQKIVYGLLGCITGWATLGVVNTAVGYSFYLAGISIHFFSPIGIFLAIVKISVATLPYWLLRSRYPYFANGILIGIGLTVFVLLLLLPFSEL